MGSKTSRGALVLGLVMVLGCDEGSGSGRAAGATCGPGTVALDGQCVPAVAEAAGDGGVSALSDAGPHCGDGTVLREGACVPDDEQCDEGTERRDGRCVPIDGPVMCGEGTVLRDGRCVAEGGVICGPGTSEQDGACVPDDERRCGPGTQEDAGGDCVPADDICGEGTERRDGRCVPTGEPVECGEGTLLRDGACVPDGPPVECGEGTLLVEGRCVPAETVRCGPGTVLEDGACIPEEQAECGPGTVLREGVCVPAAEACGPGTELIDGACVATIEQVDCGEGTERVGNVCERADRIIVAEGDALVLAAGEGAAGAILPEDGRVRLIGASATVPLRVFLVPAEGGFPAARDVTAWAEFEIDAPDLAAFDGALLRPEAEGVTAARATLAGLTTPDVRVEVILVGGGEARLVPSLGEIRLDPDAGAELLRVERVFENGYREDVTDQVSVTADADVVAVGRTPDDALAVTASGTGATVLRLTLDDLTTQVPVEAYVPVVSPYLVIAERGALLQDGESAADLRLPPDALLGDALAWVRAVDDGVEIGPSGTELARPAEIRIPLSEPMAPGEIVDLELLDEASGEWRNLGPRAAVAADGLTVLAPIRHFSRYRAGGVVNVGGLCRSFRPEFFIDPLDAQPISVDQLLEISELRRKGLLRDASVSAAPERADLQANDGEAYYLKLKASYWDACLTPLGRDGSWPDICQPLPVYGGPAFRPTVYCRPTPFVHGPPARVGERNLIALQYWLFFDSSGLPVGRDGTSQPVYHEGDAEMVQVTVDASGESPTLVGVTASQHYYGETRLAGDVPMMEGSTRRPRISIAKRSHASMYADRLRAGTGAGNGGFRHRFDTDARLVLIDMGGDVPLGDYELEVIGANQLDGDRGFFMRWQGHYGDDRDRPGGDGPRAPRYRGPADDRGLSMWSDPGVFLDAFHTSLESILDDIDLRSMFCFNPVTGNFASSYCVSRLRQAGARLFALHERLRGCVDGNPVTAGMAELPEESLLGWYDGAGAALDEVAAALPGCGGSPPAAPGCENDCDFEGQRGCAQGGGRRVCGQFDDSACLSWSRGVPCAEGQRCDEGVCVGERRACDPAAPPRCETVAGSQIHLACRRDGSGYQQQNCTALGLRCTPDGCRPAGVAPDGWVRVDPGLFLMGSPVDEPGRYNDETLHRVRITRPFFLKATEVTQGEWRALMGGSNPSWFQGCGDDYPVETVNWYEALAYCNALSRLEGRELCYELGSCNGRLPGDDMECDEVVFAGLDCAGYRLPTEAEWEYAARAGNAEARYGELDDIAWYDRNSGGTTHPVALKAPNAWGLYDTLGNVWEWTWDWYASDYGGLGDPLDPLVDPLGPDGGAWRVVRGGSWNYNARSVRAPNRYRNEPGYRFRDLGLRPARSIP